MLSPSKFHIRIRTNFFLNALLYIGGKAAKQNLYHISSNNFMKMTTQGYITTIVSLRNIPVQLDFEKAVCLRKQYWQPTYPVIKATPLVSKSETYFKNMCEYQQKWIRNNKELCLIRSGSSKHYTISSRLEKKVKPKRDFQTYYPTCKKEQYQCYSPCETQLLVGMLARLFGK